jgi:hypothetical protein
MQRQVVLQAVGFGHRPEAAAVAAVGLLALVLAQARGDVRGALLARVLLSAVLAEGAAAALFAPGLPAAVRADAAAAALLAGALLSAVLAEAAAAALLAPALLRPCSQGT